MNIIKKKIVCNYQTHEEGNQAEVVHIRPQVSMSYDVTNLKHYIILAYMNCQKNRKQQDKIIDCRLYCIIIVTYKAWTDAFLRTIGKYYKSPNACHLDRMTN